MSGPAHDRQERVTEWLIGRIAELLDVDPARIGPDQPFVQLGLSSMQAVQLAGDLEEWTGHSLPPTLAYDYPTIAAAAGYVASLGAPDQPAAHTPPGDDAPASAAAAGTVTGTGGPDEAAGPGGANGGRAAAYQGSGVTGQAAAASAAGAAGRPSANGGAPGPAVPAHVPSGDDHPAIAAAAGHVDGGSGRAFAGGGTANGRPAAPAAYPGGVTAGGAGTGPMPVAIVGIGCRMPGGAGVEGYWRTLREGVDAVREIPPDRWDADALYDPDPDTPGRMNTRWGGFLDDIQGFDADFFGISTREASRMDPQQRIVLEVAWEALEDAGIAPGSLAGSRTGVYLGASTYDHGAGLLASGTPADAYDGTGSALSVIANRLSYCLDSRGPSMIVDTACSSSLVAVHLACRALRAGEADLALAGGVNIITSPRIALSFSQGRLMAPDGRCKTFDHRANGYVRSEGAGIVVLKPLAAALADGDRIYAVIRGGAVNQDGRTNGLAAPNRLAQEDVLRAAYADAGIDPAEVDYVEAHGTGTAVGDPIEVGALASVLGRGRSPQRPLRVGSAKSNIGHTEAAAGVAGLIKTALALHHRELPPTVHFERPNPLLGLDRLPIVVQHKAEPWPERPGATPIAGVSSFGFGGANSHVVLTAAPPVRAGDADAATDPGAVLFPVSARTEAGLRRRAAGWAEAARRHGGDPGWLRRAAAAAARRTDHERHRAAVVAADAAELAEAMDALAAGRRAAGQAGPAGGRRRSPRPVLVFPGQGAQWPGMGRVLAAAVPAFRDAIRRCDEAIARYLGHRLWSDEAGLVAEGTAHVQPALFAYQVALAETWLSWGVRPAAVIGHSMGEIAAAHVAGVLSLDDAARLVCERSGLLTRISGRGGMALVELEADEAARMIHGREHELSIAAVNGPRATVLSGAPHALDEVVAALSDRGVFARRVAVDFAAHSPEVEPLRPLLGKAIAGITPGAATTTLYSTVTGEPVAGPELDPAYWMRNMREPVLFSPAVARLLDEGHDTFLEMAPHPVLTRSIADTADHAGVSATVISSVRRDEDEARALLGALGELYARGAEVDWRALHPVAPHVDLPPQGWDRRHFPLLTTRTALQGTPPPLGGTATAPAGGALLGHPIRVGADPDLRLWPVTADLTGAPELADHAVEGVPVVPGAYWLAAAAQAAAGLTGNAANGTAAPEADGSGASAAASHPAPSSGPSGAAERAAGVALADVAFERPCPAGTTPVDVQLALRADGQGSYGFVVTSDPGGGPVRHAHGRVAGAAGAGGDGFSPGDLAARLGPATSADQLYERLHTVGLEYGPRFRGVVELRMGEGEALARIRLPEGLRQDCSPMHPALLDACFHAVAAAAGDRVGSGVLPLPVGAGQVWVRRDAPALREGWCHAVVRTATRRELTADVTVVDNDGRPVWTVRGLRVELLDRRPAEQGRLYTVRWEPVEPPAGARTAGAWLVLDGGDGLGRGIAARLAAAGRPYLLAVPAPCAPQERSPQEGYAKLIEEASALPGGLAGVLDARATVPAAPGADRLHSHAADAVALVQALTRYPWRGDPPRLWLLTSARRALAGTVVRGLARVVAAEHPELACSLVDAGPEDLATVAAVLDGGAPPGEYAVRDGVLLEPRLRMAPRGGMGGAQGICSHGTYLITGGYGALGLRVARWLARKGARDLVLLGRREPGPEALRVAEELRAAGVRVRAERADTADAARLAEVIDGIPELAGVFHLAGVLEDALVDGLGDDALRRAIAGKAAGAWHLHRLTEHLPIKQFVLFSSMAGLFGSPGQGAYAAANTFLDALAAARAERGLPARSIDWGTWSGTGLAVTGGGADRLAARGVPPLDPEIALELLEEALAGTEPHVAAAAVNWPEFGRAGLSPVLERLLRGLITPRGDGAAGEGAGAAGARGAVGAAVRAAQTPAEKVDVLRRFLLEQSAAVLGRPAADVDTAVPLQELGFDSLMAMELRTRLETGLGIRLSATVVYTYPTIEALAEGLLYRLSATGDAAPAPDGQAAGTAADPATGTAAAPDPASEDGTGAAADDAADATDAADLGRMADAELAALLSEELKLHREIDL